MLSTFMILLSFFITALLVVPWLMIILSPLLIFLAPAALVAVNIHGIYVLRKVFKSEYTRVLIVDDEPASTGPLVLALNSLSAEVEIAIDGPRAIELLREKSFDLVILDYMMPGMSGKETLDEGEKVITGMEKIPVVFYTGYSDQLSHLKKIPFEHFVVKDIIDKTTYFPSLIEHLSYALALTQPASLEFDGPTATA